MLVPEVNADLIQAAIGHGKLTADQRALVVDADAQASDDAVTMTLTPRAPLAAGTFYLLIASRLKDAQGHKIAGNGARYAFTVAKSPARVVLDAPPAGWSAPRNLRRVRLSFPDGVPDGKVAIIQHDGGVLGGPLDADGGPLVVELAASDGGSLCDPLCPGSSLAVLEGTEEAFGATFTASACGRLSPPAFQAGTPTIRAGDRFADVSIALDWPALVHIEARTEAGVVDATTDLLMSCQPDACDGGASDACAANVRLEGLSRNASYRLHVSAEDDEGHAPTTADVPFSTVHELPNAVISEVMASPPLPLPRSDGEFIEIWNRTAAPLDPAHLALEGSDGRARAVDIWDAGAVAPGQRALAVGQSFDPSRYAIPSGTPLWHAETQRLLGRGVADDPPAIRLLWVDDDGGTAELDRYPGSGPGCDPGESLERISDGDGGWPVFDCGVDGGSPGRAPGG